MGATPLTHGASAPVRCTVLLDGSGLFYQEIEDKSVTREAVGMRMLHHLSTMMCATTKSCTGDSTPMIGNVFQ